MYLSRGAWVNNSIMYKTCIISSIPFIVFSSKSNSKTIAQHISTEKLKLAINRFGPFKSPDLDDSGIMANCQSYIHPKAGKIKLCRANDFRPKSLSSFFIKSLEKFIDEDLRGHLSTYDISSCQHAIW